jgi:single-strand DNA-binding protein
MVNRVILVGRIGKEPETKQVNDSKVTKVTLATSETYKKDGNKVETTEWHTVIAWRGLAEVIEKYVKKGDLLYVEGRIKTRMWEDKDGKKNYTTEIQADNIQMLGGKKEEAKPESKLGRTTAPDDDDNAPF